MPSDSLNKAYMHVLKGCTNGEKPVPAVFFVDTEITAITLLMLESEIDEDYPSNLKAQIHFDLEDRFGTILQRQQKPKAQAQELASNYCVRIEQYIRNNASELKQLMDGQPPSHAAKIKKTSHGPAKKTLSLDENLDQLLLKIHAGAAAVKGR